jgi:phenylacetate-coenzyme A ligase PaaK-like adenylate-forming protein
MQAWSKVSRMPAQNIKKMQDELLRSMVGEELAVRHPFYRSLFETAGVDPAAIKGVEDIKRLPFTSKRDLLPSAEDPFQPKKFVLELPSDTDKKSRGGLFGKKDKGADPLEYRLNQLFFTAGRTAAPVPITYTRHDLENLKEAGLRSFDIFGLGRDDTLVNAFSYAPNVSFWQIFHTTINLGSTALQTGGGRVLGMEKILRALDNMEAPVLATFPAYAQFTLQTLEHFGLQPKHLERVIIGMGYTPLIQVERIKKLMSELQAANNLVRRIYFLSEAKAGWAECEPGCGYHTNPDHTLVEIVDPETGASKPDGEAGEVVVTNLDARGTVLLRFRTGDIATGGLTHEPCPHCKRTVPRLLGDIEQKHLYFTLQGRDGGLAFNGNALAGFMIGREDVLQWYAEIVAKDKAESLRLVVKAVKGSDERETVASLEREIRERFKVPVTVETGALDGIVNTIGLERNITEQRFFDRRPA